MEEPRLTWPVLALMLSPLGVAENVPPEVPVMVGIGLAPLRQKVEVA